VTLLTLERIGRAENGRDPLLVGHGGSVPSVAPVFRNDA
jgi:hypothetical protein